MSELMRAIEQSPFGIDVSHWQNQINWHMVKSAGYEFAAIRASAGNRPDHMFEENWGGCIGANMVPMAYHYLENNVPINAQACEFIKQLGKVGCARNRHQPMLPPALDVEEGSPEPGELCDWLEAVHRTVELCPKIYTNPSFWNENIGDVARFARYPLWISHWKVASPDIPKPWTDWIMWQQTSEGRVDGIATNVDINVYNGSLDDLKWMAGIRE